MVALALSAAVPAFGQRSLVWHGAFESRLAAEDLRALREAQDAERRVADGLLRFLESYDAAAGIATAYGKASGAAAADSLYRQFGEARATARTHARELALLWERAFDNKTFAYNYLLDMAGQRAVLARMEQLSRSAVDEIAGRRDGEESEEVLKYLEQKTLIFGYERALAELLGAEAAADSLARAQTVFNMLKRPLPRLELAERSFIEYLPIKVYSPARYNAANPIPQVAEYRSGCVYRVRLGSYAARQAVSVFRGVHPLGWKQNGKMVDYYAGAYDDLAAAEKALTDMKRRGFAKALLAVWNNGELTVLGAGRFGVVIEGEELAEEVRAALGDVEVIKGDGTFTVGPFADALAAQRVVEAVRKAGMKSKLTNYE
jgi:hypothetical protein